MHFLPDPEFLPAFQPKRSPWLRYGNAIGAVTLVLFLTMSLPSIRSGTPFLFFFLAVAWSAWYGGLGAGLLSTSLSALAVVIWVFPPYGTLFFSAWRYTQLAGFLAVATIICWLVFALQQALRREHGQRALLRIQEQEFRTIFDLAGSGKAQADPATGRFLQVNRKFCEITGYSEAELLARTFSDITHPADRERDAKLALPVLRGEQSYWESEKRYLRKDGQVRWVIVTGALLRDEQGHPFRTIATILDITARKEAEQALRASEERYRTLVEAAPVFVWHTDAAGDLTYNSDRYYEYTGLCADEPKRWQAQAQQVIHPDDRAEWCARWQQSVTTGHRFEMEVRLRRADGLYHWHLNRGVPVMAADGHISGWVGTSTNIDDRRHTEAALQVAHTQMRNILESISDCFNAVSHDWRYTYINTQTERYFGRTRAEMLGQVIWELFPALVGTIFEEQYRKAMTEGQAVHFEALSPVTHQWVEVHAYPSVDGLSIYFHNITERKTIEAALREREGQLQLITDNVPALISYVDAEERYQFVNAYYTEWFGPPANTIIGRQVSEVLDAASYTHVKPYLQMALQGQRATFENEYQLGDGAMRIGSVTYVPHIGANQQVLGVYVLVFDITERKQTEQQAHLLADLSTLLAASLDYQATLQQLTQLLVPRLGDWCDVEVVGTGGVPEPVAVAHVDSAKLAWARELRQRYRPHPDGAHGIAKVIRTGQPEWYPEISDELLVRAAQDEAHLTLLRQIGLQSLLIVPLRVRGQILGALSLGWATPGRRYREADLHFAEELAQRAAMAVDNAQLYQEVRAAEAELRAMNAVLEQRVAERTRQLEQKNSELERSNQELEKFAYVASHDLRSPLRAIDNLSQWINEDAGHLLPAASKEHLAKMRGRVRRMDQLLDDLLAYSRIGRFHYNLELVDVRQLLQDIIMLLNIPPTFQVIINDPLPVFYTKRVPLESVLRNLIGNAIKHHHRPDGHVYVAAHELDERFEFIVQDDGPGIPPQFHNKIFEIFQTLQPRDKVEGSGMGLAIVKKAIEIAGGTITVESRSGCGAIFRFTWPKAEPEVG